MKRKFRKLIFRIKIFVFLLFLIIISICSIFIIQFDKYLMPISNLVTEKYATSFINSSINESVKQVINEIDLDKFKLFENYSDLDNNQLVVNSILINDICSKISTILSEKLSRISETKVEIPIGNLTGINAISNLGPKIKIGVNSVGDAVVDYETKFESVGINQINFQVWLNINTKIDVIGSFVFEQVNVKRKLMLVNTIFSGKVPQTYLNNQTNSLNDLSK